MKKEHRKIYVMTILACALIVMSLSVVLLDWNPFDTEWKKTVDVNWASVVNENKYGNDKIMTAVNVLGNRMSSESDLKQLYPILRNGNSPEIEFHAACAIAGWYYWNGLLPDSISVKRTNPGPNGIQPIVEKFIETGSWELAEQSTEPNKAAHPSR